MSPSASPDPTPCKVSTRAANMAAFQVVEIMKEAMRLEASSDQSAEKVLHLEIGQPSTPPPKTVLEHISSLSYPLGYSSSLGTDSLRQAISCHYSKWYRVDLPPSSIAITTGASGAFLVAMTTCFDPHDRVAVTVPGYPCNANVLIALSMEVVPIYVDASTNFQPTIQQLREAQPLDGVIIATPANPTGSVISPTDLAELVSFCRQSSIRLIVDEIYHGIGKLTSTAMEYDNVVVINSFSKYWCMTGFRVGWLACRDKKTMVAVNRCLQNYSICAPMLSQQAAEKALDDECREELQRNVSRYQRNQRVVLEKLLACGFHATFPEGAFYLWAECDDVCRKVGVKDSTELSSVFVKQIRVVVVPGTDFDKKEGQHFIRFSCAGSEEDVKEAAQRIYDFCSR